MTDNLPSQIQIRKIIGACQPNSIEAGDLKARIIESYGDILASCDCKEGFVCLVFDKNFNPDIEVNVPE